MRTMHAGKPRIETVKLGRIVRRALASWLKDGAPGMGAAISFSLLISATGMFAVLQNALRRIWRSPPHDT
jgi:uncharacterized BrkB/YihY/UPF0761 family membrane protein